MDVSMETRAPASQGAPAPDNDWDSAQPSSIQRQTLSSHTPAAPIRAQTSKLLRYRHVKPCARVPAHTTHINGALLSRPIDRGSKPKRTVRALERRTSPFEDVWSDIDDSTPVRYTDPNSGLHRVGAPRHGRHHSPDPLNHPFNDPTLFDPPTRSFIEDPQQFWKRMSTTHSIQLKEIHTPIKVNSEKVIEKDAEEEIDKLLDLIDTSLDPAVMFRRSMDTEQVQGVGKSSARLLDSVLYGTFLGNVLGLAGSGLSFVHAFGGVILVMASFFDDGDGPETILINVQIATLGFKDTFIDVFRSMFF